MTLVLLPSLAFATTDAEVRDLIIKASVQSYPGNCPCPYNTMRNGRACGGRSAYSRPGGRSPLCYPKDVSDQMVKAYRTQHNLK
uniref:Uncharacterized protein n=1 Tax=Desulfovibrio sp. U5L TaxID=596152 RepID=I2Q055_9BACT